MEVQHLRALSAHLNFPAAILVLLREQESSRPPVSKALRPAVLLFFKVPRRWDKELQVVPEKSVFLFIVSFIPVQLMQVFYYCSNYLAIKPDTNDITLKINLHIELLDLFQ